MHIIYSSYLRQIINHMASYNSHDSAIVGSFGPFNNFILFLDKNKHLIIYVKSPNGKHNKIFHYIIYI